ncbi:Mbov_0395 family pilin-like conjugal transfer protein [Butyrivibrio sp. WCD3002]|uniref:Mbov_0395 family pilin-like conjugal transfer protein n=1 Tax=Butyrivibrio sp. WCD3002 TaxID=1280676 RepID=UPI00040E77BE|nr:pilin [Butyrivibrio sp. WCD3002]
MLQTILAKMTIMAADASTTVNVDFSGVATPIVEMLNKILAPLIMIVGALGAIWCVLLGVKLAKADEPQEREKAKMALKNAITGYLLIFILVVVLRLTIGPLYTWMQANKTTLTTGVSFAQTMMARFF